MTVDCPNCGNDRWRKTSDDKHQCSWCGYRLGGLSRYIDWYFEEWQQYRAIWLFNVVLTMFSPFYIVLQLLDRWLVKRGYWLPAW
jgi:hypothetical protein